MAALSGVYWYFSAPSTSQISKDPKVVFEELKNQVEEAMKSPRAIDATLERNPNPFACLYQAEANCTGRGGQVQFFEDVNAQPISQLLRDSGLTKERVGCKGFPNANCPFRIEAAWQPVCDSNRCEGTKSFRIKVKVIYSAGTSQSPEEWSHEEMYSPTIKISENTNCVRGGGIWSGTECLTPDQANDRNIASKNGVIGPNGMNEDQMRREEGMMGASSGGNDAGSNGVRESICPNQIALQSQYWSLEMLSPGRGQVRMPAVNGCPAEDVFVFQCMPKVPAEFEGEGQWIQVEAQMAPHCDGAGNPIDPVLRQ